MTTPDNESKVERVARALFISAGFEPEEWMMANPATWHRQARAAIAAMREPTEAMTDACRDVDNGEYTGITSNCAREAWQAMVDAALNGK